jgi:hypothetical protein
MDRLCSIGTALRERQQYKEREMNSSRGEIDAEKEIACLEEGSIG